MCKIFNSLFLGYLLLLLLSSCKSLVVEELGGKIDTIIVDTNIENKYNPDTLEGVWVREKLRAEFDKNSKIFNFLDVLERRGYWDHDIHHLSKEGESYKYRPGTQLKLYSLLAKHGEKDVEEWLLDQYEVYLDTLDIGRSGGMEYRLDTYLSGGFIAGLRRLPPSDRKVEIAMMTFADHDGRDPYGPNADVGFRCGDCSLYTILYTSLQADSWHMSVDTLLGDAYEHYEDIFLKYAYKDGAISIDQLEKFGYPWYYIYEFEKTDNPQALRELKYNFAYRVLVKYLYDGYKSGLYPLREREGWEFTRN